MIGAPVRAWLTPQFWVRPVRVRSHLAVGNRLNVPRG